MSTATNERQFTCLNLELNRISNFMGLFRQSDGKLRNEESRESSDSPFEFMSNFRSALSCTSNKIFKTNVCDDFLKLCCAFLFFEDLFL